MTEPIVNPHQYRRGLLKDLKKFNDLTVYVLQQKDSEWLANIMKALRKSLDKSVRVVVYINSNCDYVLYITHEYQYKYDDITLKNILTKLRHERAMATVLCEQFEEAVSKSRERLKICQDNE